MCILNYGSALMHGDQPTSSADSVLCLQQGCGADEPVNAAEFSALQSKSAVKVAVVVRAAAQGTLVPCLLY